MPTITVPRLVHRSSWRVLYDRAMSELDTAYELISDDVRYTAWTENQSAVWAEIKRKGNQ